MRLIKLAYREISARKLRSALTTLGIAIGVALIFAVAVTNKSVVNSFTEVVADLSGAADLQINDTAAGFVPAEIEAKAESVSGVARAAPVISRYTLAGKQKPSNRLQIVGVDWAAEKGFRRYRRRRGRFLTGRGREVVLVKSWADEQRLRVGGKLRLQGVRGIVEFKVVGLTAKVGPGAADNGRVAFINLKDAQEVFGLKDKLTQVDVKVKSNQDTAVVKRRLRSRLKAAYEVSRPQDKSASIEAVTKGMMSAFGSFGSLALFIGAFVVFNTMMMSVAERRRQMGLLRLVGATRRQILTIILWESSFFGIAGSVIGLGLGQALAQSLSRQVAKVYHLTITNVGLPWNWAAISFLTGTVIAVLAGLQPAWRASIVTPIESIRGGNVAGGNWLERFGWLPGSAALAAGTAVFLSPLKNNYGALAYDLGSGLIFVGMALLSLILVKALIKILRPPALLIFGHEGRLAVDGLNKSLSRAALAVVVLLVSTSMVIAAGELSTADNSFLENWIEAVLPFDVSVRTPLPNSVLEIHKYTPVDIGLGDKIKKIAGVAEAAPIKFVTAKGLGRTLFIISIESKSWARTNNVKFEEGDKRQAVKEFNRGGMVFISSTITSKNNIHAGQKIKMTTPAGKRYFKVGGVFPSVANDGYVVYISRRDQIRYWRDKSTDGFNVTLKKGAHLQPVMKKIKRVIAGQSGLDVLSGRDIRDEVRKSVNGFLAVINALVLVAIVVTALGIINTLAMNVMERIREIGVLRAIGSSKRQIKKMVFVEAALIGISGAVLGGGVGLLVAWQLVVISQLVGGWKVPFIFPYEYLAVALLLSVVVTMLAALYPARQAAEVDIVKAVQWE